MISTNLQVYSYQNCLDLFDFLKWGFRAFFSLQDSDGNDKKVNTDNKRIQK